MSNGPVAGPFTPDQAAVIGIPAYTTTRYRTGRKLGRTIYATHPDGTEQLVGLMDTPELAAQVVGALGAVDRLLGPLPAGHVCDDRYPTGMCPDCPQTSTPPTEAGPTPTHQDDPERPSGTLSAGRACPLCGGRGMNFADCGWCGKRADPPQPCPNCGRTSHGFACATDDGGRS